MSPLLVSSTYLQLQDMPVVKQELIGAQKEKITKTLKDYFDNNFNKFGEFYSGLRPEQLKYFRGSGGLIEGWNPEGTTHLFNMKIKENGRCEIVENKATRNEVIRIIIDNVTKLVANDMIKNGWNKKGQITEVHIGKDKSYINCDEDSLHKENETYISIKENNNVICVLKLIPFKDGTSRNSRLGNLVLFTNQGKLKRSPLLKYGKLPTSFDGTELGGEEITRIFRIFHKEGEKFKFPSEPTKK